MSYVSQGCGQTIYRFQAEWIDRFGCWVGGPRYGPSAGAIRLQLQQEGARAVISVWKIERGLAVEGP